MSPAFSFAKWLGLVITYLRICAQFLLMNLLLSGRVCAVRKSYDLK